MIFIKILTYLVILAIMIMQNINLLGGFVMKKVLSMVMVIAMLACVFAVNVAAVDNYEPKTINLIANADGTASLPEGYVVYIGDTLVFPRGEMVFIDDLKVRDSGEIREMAVGVLNDYMIDVDGVRIGQSWSDDITLNNNAIKDGNKYWFEDGANIEVAGKFDFYAFSARDAAWTEQYLLEPMIKILSIDVVDPKTVDEIVLPPVAGTDAPADEPADEPTTDTPADEPTTDTPADDKTDDKTDDTAAPAPANNTLIYIIVGVVAAIVAVVVIVLVSKKKK